eukprot:gene7741-916_t
MQRKASRWRLQTSIRDEASRNYVWMSLSDSSSREASSSPEQPGAACYIAKAIAIGLAILVASYWLYKIRIFEHAARTIFAQPARSFNNRVQQAKKSPKWSCVLCGQKQSLTKVYAISTSAKDCRLCCSELNLSRGEEEEQEAAQAEEAEQLALDRMDQDHPDHDFGWDSHPNPRECAHGAPEASRVGPSNQWAEYAEAEEDMSGSDGEWEADHRFVTTVGDRKRRGGASGKAPDRQRSRNRQSAAELEDDDDMKASHGTINGKHRLANTNNGVGIGGGFRHGIQGLSGTAAAPAQPHISTPSGRAPWQKPAAASSTAAATASLLGGVSAPSRTAPMWQRPTTASLTETAAAAFRLGGVSASSRAALMWQKPTVSSGAFKQAGDWAAPPAAKPTQGGPWAAPVEASAHCATAAAWSTAGAAAVPTLQKPAAAIEAGARAAASTWQTPAAASGTGAVTSTWQRPATAATGGQVPTWQKPATAGGETTKAGAATTSCWSTLGEAQRMPLAPSQARCNQPWQAARADQRAGKFSSTLSASPSATPQTGLPWQRSQAGTDTAGRHSATGIASALPNRVLGQGGFAGPQLVEAKPAAAAAGVSSSKWGGFVEEEEEEEDDDGGGFDGVFATAL